MVVTLPLPSQVTQYFPQSIVSFLSWFAFYTFAALLTIPLLFCIFQLITHNVGRERRIKTVLDEESAPKTVIVMPCYKEDPDVLLKAIDSVVCCEYPPSCLHVFLSFDGDQVDELYVETLENLGVPVPLSSYPNSIDLVYRDARVTVSRFPHGGKRKCQKSTFKLIDKIYTEYVKRNDDLFILFIDSDCILDKVCIQNFMYEMELKPGSKHNMLAMTGVITSTTKTNSLITILQDMEYIHGQLFERSVESGCGAVTCLPGALTMLRFSAFRKMAKYYFADKAEQCNDLFDYGKCHLGEDRWLTHLFMIGAKQRYQIQMCTGAFCKTEAVQTYKSLLKQRRRWFLGYITNEACMLTDLRLWVKYPLLCIVRLMQNTIRTTALLFFIMILSLLTTEQSINNLPVGFIGVSLGLNWALMFFFGAKLRRFKIWLYPLMFVINPFFNWCYMIYGIFTAGQRTWGGPRADAAAADVDTSPQEAIEIAKAQGDDLNIIPESFKPAAEARHPDRFISDAPLHPSNHLGGRFTVPDELPGGWYMHSNIDSTLTLSLPLRHRDSAESWNARNSIFNYSMYMPLTLEEIMSEEDQRKWHFAQAASRNASTTSELDLFEDPQLDPGFNDNDIANGYGRVYELSDDDGQSSSSSRRRQHWPKSRSMASLANPAEFDSESQKPPSTSHQARSSTGNHQLHHSRPPSPFPDVSSPLSPSPSNRHRPHIPSGLSQEWRTGNDVIGAEDDHHSALRPVRGSRLERLMRGEEDSEDNERDRHQQYRNEESDSDNDEEDLPPLELSARHFALQTAPRSWRQRQQQQHPLLRQPQGTDDDLQQEEEEEAEEEEEEEFPRGRTRTRSHLHTGRSVYDDEEGEKEEGEDYEEPDDHHERNRGLDGEADDGGTELQDMASSSSQAQAPGQSPGETGEQEQQRRSRWRSVGRKLRKRRGG